MRGTAYHFATYGNLTGTAFIFSMYAIAYAPLFLLAVVNSVTWATHKCAWDEVFA